MAAASTGRSFALRLLRIGYAAVGVGVVAAWSAHAGCAAGGPIPASIPPPAPAGPGAPTAKGKEGSRKAVAASAPTARPVRSPEAQAAHLAAQRALLPDDDLLEPAPGLSAGLPVETLAVAPADDVLAHLPGSSGLAAGGARPSIDGNSLGSYVPLSGDPHALDAFYRSLDALAGGRDHDGKVRVLLYGASHTEADIYPHYLRVYLRHRFGDGGHGFIQAARPKPWYRHVELRVRSTRHWLAEHAQRARPETRGWFGLSGLSTVTSKARARSVIEHTAGSVASHYEVYYLAWPRGGSFDLYVDGTRHARIRTRADEVAPGVYATDLPEAPHRIEIRPRGDGPVRLFGVVAERDQPGVVVDTLGIGGTRAANMLAWDEDLWSAYVRRRDPSLVVLAYGTNEATDEDQPIDAYARDLDAVLTRLRRAAPEASCVLMGPGDFPVVAEDGTVVPRPRLAQIVEIQRRAATAHGCGFWDMLAFMGGPGSMATWVASAPPMARRDHIHLTRRGYAKVGMAFADALFSPYDHRILARAP